MQPISRTQILERAKGDNPWWAEPHKVPAPYSDWTPRPYIGLLGPLLEDNGVRRAVVLMGPRRVGKTVMIHHMIGLLLDADVPAENIAYFSVDHPLYTGMSLEEFLGIATEATGVNYRSGGCYVFFDEVQYLRDWERHLKSLVDSYPGARFLVSGSAAAALRMKSTESGAGRFTDFLLPPLTFYEYLTITGQGKGVSVGDDALFPNPSLHDDTGFSALNSLFLDYINFGGYPEAALSEKIQSAPGRFIRSDIVDKVLLRDLPSLYGIQDIQELNRLFTSLAYNTGNEVSLEGLSKNSGVSKNTLRKYIEYLEAAFLIRTVNRVDRNARQFKRANTFKVYLTNPSMRSALFSPVAADDSSMGDLVETAIYSQYFHGQEALYYARWKNGEVDIVSLDANQTVLSCVEVKWSDRFFHNPHELTGLVSFCRAHHLPKAVVTTISSAGSRVVDDVTIVFRPACTFCLSLGVSVLKPHRQH